MSRRKTKYKISKAEKTILILLQELGLDVIAQFKIEGIPYIYDFYFPQLNKILEYQGDYWHANPKIYKSGSLIRMVGFKEKVLVDYLWDKDNLKKQSAEKQGYNVITLWEEDFKKNGIESIRHCLNIV